MREVFLKISVVIRNQRAADRKSESIQTQTSQHDSLFFFKWDLLTIIYSAQNRFDN